MVKLRNWHKYAGLWSAAILLILAITGFFLDHKSWSFLYTTTISNNYLPQSMHDKSVDLTEAYWVDETRGITLVGSKRGLFLKDDAEHFVPVLEQQVLAIREERGTGALFCATDNGLYRSLDAKRWTPFALSGSYINALSLYEGTLVAVIEKEELVVLDAATAAVKSRSSVRIDPQELQHDISLSRYVRDFHYGRGLFDGFWSLLINDITAFVMTLLSVTGLMIWWIIKKVRAKERSYVKGLKPTIKSHGNIYVLLFVLPMVLFSLTGIILDHSQFFNRYIKKVTLSHAILPPIYDSLQADIWSVDYDGTSYRIGNRYGIYKSSDLKEWRFENRGLGYKMERFDDTLVVSGMGAPNRIYRPETGWKLLLKTPHMFKDVWEEDGRYHFFSTHRLDVSLPTFETTTLYSLLLALHDGTFFASWWVYVNDVAAILLLILLFSGTWRWFRQKRGVVKKLRKRI